MSNFDELLRNNLRFAATDVKNHQPPIPFIAARTELDEAKLADSAVLDPAQTVPVDVQKFQDYPYASSKIKISGYAYDVKTGLVSTVVPSRSA